MHPADGRTYERGDDIPAGRTPAEDLAF